MQKLNSQSPWLFRCSTLWWFHIVRNWQEGQEEFNYWKIWQDEVGDISFHAKLKLQLPCWAQVPISQPPNTSLVNMLKITYINLKTVMLWQWARSSQCGVTENKSERENWSTILGKTYFLIHINCLLGLCLLMWKLWKNYVRYHIKTGNRWCLTGCAGEEAGASSFGLGCTTRTAAACLFFSLSLRKISVCLWIPVHHVYYVLIYLHTI